MKYKIYGTIDGKYCDLTAETYNEPVKEVPRSNIAMIGDLLVLDGIRHDDLSEYMHDRIIYVHNNWTELKDEDLNKIIDRWSEVKQEILNKRKGE